MSSTTTPNIDVNEKNLAVSFIQFIRQKVSTNQCTEDQVEGLEGMLIYSIFDNVSSKTL
jgi:hypothetical protein